MEKWQLGFNAESRVNRTLLRELAEASAEGPISLREVRMALLVHIAEQLSCLWDRAKVSPGDVHHLKLEVVMTPSRMAFPGRTTDAEGSN